mmetsp:Transcript_27674/g.65727  ORF Transcript_27674/g.65727 Transcript_27674/m.65727 type:complete len:258 (+) Transcript_27674:477-1250(+)
MAPKPCGKPVQWSPPARPKRVNFRRWSFSPVFAPRSSQWCGCSWTSSAGTRRASCRSPTRCSARPRGRRCGRPSPTGTSHAPAPGRGGPGARSASCCSPASAPWRKPPSWSCSRRRACPPSASPPSATTPATRPCTRRWGRSSQRPCSSSGPRGGRCPALCSRGARGSCRSSAPRRRPSTAAQTRTARRRTAADELKRRLRGPPGPGAPRRSLRKSPEGAQPDASRSPLMGPRPLRPRKPRRRQVWRRARHGGARAT